MIFSEGNTNNYLIYGVGVLVFSLLTLLYSFYVFIPFFVISIALFSGRNGLEWKFKEGRYRKLANFFGIHIGAWEVIDKSGKILLRIQAENSSMEGLVGIAGYLPQANTSVKTFDIVWQGENPLDQKILYSFLDYKLARKILVHAHKSGQYEVVDLVAEKIQMNKKRRSR